MKVRIFGLLMALTIAGMGILPTDAPAQNGCQSQTAIVVMATPMSSRIDRVGDPLQAVLSHLITLAPGKVLPAGTLLKGKVISIKKGKSTDSGQIQFRFTQAITADNSPYIISAIPATPDGWLHQSDANTPVWGVSLTRSTRLLNERIQRRLGTNRAVWAQILGMNENTIPDPTTDEFIADYNRHDVLIGAGDRIQLQLSCP